VQLAKDMLSIADTAPRRIGQWPKTLLMVRSSAGPKMMTAPYKLASDTFDHDPHKVEILGTGQQFVAYGVHPVTKREYEWNGAGDPLTVKFDSLPFVAESRLQAYLDAAEQLLTEYGTRCGRLGRDDRGTLHKPNDDLRGDIAIVSSAVRAIPNDDLSRDDWITMGHAIKGALGEEGLPLWLEWSRSSGKSGKSGVANTPERAWKSFTPRAIGAGTIYFEAKRYGWVRPIRQMPEPPEHLNDIPLEGKPEKPSKPGAHQKRGLVLRPAAEVAAQPTRAEWLLRPYLERNVLALMYGEFGTLKSFAALEFGLCVASGEPSMAFPNAIVHGGNVIYISAEGKGLWRRLKGWSIARKINLEDVRLWAIERPVDTFNQESLLELAEAINALQVKPDLIIIDTLSRNSGAADENKSADMSAYLNGLDKMLRVPFECTILLVHHVGHMEKTRARGSYILMANTDSNYLVVRPDQNRLLIELKTGRLKDSESPPAVTLLGRIVELGSKDEDGKPETTLVLDSTEEVAPSKKREPTGKNQQRALDILTAAIKNGDRMLEAEAVRRVRTATNMVRQRAEESVRTLVQNGYLVKNPAFCLELPEGN